MEKSLAFVFIIFIRYFSYSWALVSDRFPKLNAQLYLDYAKPDAEADEEGKLKAAQEAEQDAAWAGSGGKAPRAGGRGSRGRAPMRRASAQR